jgi:AcrR family transcriptional regulator
MADRPIPQPDPPYRRIVAELRRRIAAGELRVGDRVPSTRQLARHWGVATATATKALAALGQEGLVQAVPRVGTLVAAPPPPPPPRPPASRPTRPRPPQAPGPELTRERILHAAIAIADAEGLTAVSMRRLAAELGVGVMSLYRHVPGKDQLVLLMADAVFGEARPPQPPPPGWRAQLELIARLQWAAARRHPWIARVVSLTRPTPAPNAMAYTEGALRAVDGLGLAPSTMLYVAITLAGHVQATACASTSPHPDPHLHQHPPAAPAAEPLGGTTGGTTPHPPTAQRRRPAAKAPRTQPGPPRRPRPRQSRGC